MKVNVFMQATKMKLRFTTPQGEITTEQLWDLPLGSDNPDKACLQKLAIEMIAIIAGSKKKDGLKSYIGQTTSVKESLKFDVVMGVIEGKLEDNSDAIQGRKNDERKHKLLQALEDLSNKATGEMTEAEIKKELKSL